MSLISSGWFELFFFLIIFFISYFNFELVKKWIFFFMSYSDLMIRVIILISSQVTNLTISSQVTDLTSWIVFYYYYYYLFLPSLPFPLYSPNPSPSPMTWSRNKQLHILSLKGLCVMNRILTNFVFLEKFLSLKINIFFNHMLLMIHHGLVSGCI